MNFLSVNACIKSKSNGAIILCFSYNIIEQQALEMFKKIQQNSHYKLVRVEFTGDQALGLIDYEELTKMENKLISKIILKDNKGMLYSIEPNLNGLRFAKGEISYREYKKIQKKESTDLFVYLFLIIAFFSILMWTVIRYLT